MRKVMDSGLLAGAAFVLALAILLGAGVAKVLAAGVDTIVTSPSGDVTCPEGSTPRQEFFDHLLAPDTGWLLHSAHTGDNLAAFWEDMPPPPAALRALTVEAVIFQSPQQSLAAVVFFRADGCSIGHYGPVPMQELFARLGLTEA